MKSLKRASLAAALAGVALLGLSACSQPYTDTSTRTDTGAITEGGEVGVFQLQLGDCIHDPSMVDVESEVDQVSSVAAVPCAQTHAGEVILVDDEFFAAEEAYPGEEVIEARSSEACVAALEEYTGVAYLDGNFDALPVYPTQEGWDAVQDRGIVCIGITLTQDTWMPIESTGSIKAAA